MKTAVNKAAAIVLALACTAPTAGAVMIDNFVNGVDFGLEYAMSDGCKLYQFDTCPHARRDFAVGDNVRAGSESIGPFGPFDGVIVGDYRTGYVSAVGGISDGGNPHGYVGAGIVDPFSPDGIHGGLFWDNAGNFYGEGLRSTLTLVWDGQARNFSENPSGGALPVSTDGFVNPVTLPVGVDLTRPTTPGSSPADGFHIAFRHTAFSKDYGWQYPPGVRFTFDVWSDDGSRQARSTLVTMDDDFAFLEFPFASFVGTGDPVDFTRASALRLEIDGLIGTSLALAFIDTRGTTPVPVPVPATSGLLLTGLLATGWFGRRRSGTAGAASSTSGTSSFRRSSGFPVVIRFLRQSSRTLAILLGFAGVADAAIIDLGHPSRTPFMHDAIVGFGGTGDRNLVFDATSAFAVAAIGIRFEPLAGGATTLQVDIRAVSLTGGVGTRGALLATARAAISANGLGFYDVPISFSFVAGKRYDVGLLPVAPETWGNSGLNSMAFYEFDHPQAAYEVGGVLSVVDGGQSDAQDGTGGGYSNSVMPHLRFNTVASPIPVPLPGTMALLGLGLSALGAVRRRRR